MADQCEFADLEAWFPGEGRYYRDALDVIVAWRREHVGPALARADRVLEDGGSVAGYVTYEGGVALEGTTCVPSLDDSEPLLVIGIYDGPSPMPPPEADGEAILAPLVAETTWPSYAGHIDAIKRSIHDGDVYQVNLTVPFSAMFAGDPLALFRALVASARVPHAAFVRHRGRAIVSCSPELFLRFDGHRVGTKPMKGTSTSDATAELKSEKNRAEHLMIVDLLRNDLNRMGRAASTSGLFTIERYPTFATMTTLIEADLSVDSGLAGVFAATMPAGSITGAPKHAAIHHIAAHESKPRGVSMGSIGFYEGREKRGTWNIAIRTLDIDTRTGRVRTRIGGGIVGDSEARAEWAEILVKRRVFDTVAPPPGLIETLRITANGELIRLERHLARMERSAFAFGLAFKVDAVRAMLLAKSREPRPADALLRIELRADGLLLSERPIDEPAAAVRVMVASQRLNRHDPTCRHKSTRRAAYDAALNEARTADCFEAVLLESAGAVADGSRTTIFVAGPDALWTPPLSDAALAGVLREEMLANGAAIERRVSVEDLRSRPLFIGNSGRGMMPAILTQ